MNRFIIDYDVVSIAQSLCDQHIVKMPLEECQMLCTALWHHATQSTQRRMIYINQFIKSIHVHCGRCTVEVIMNMRTACALCYARRIPPQI